MSHAWATARIVWALVGVLALAASGVGAYLSLRPGAPSEPASLAAPAEAVRLIARHMD